MCGSCAGVSLNIHSCACLCADVRALSQDMNKCDVINIVVRHNNNNKTKSNIYFLRVTSGNLGCSLCGPHVPVITL